MESAKRWRDMVRHAMVSSPTLTVLSTASFAYLAYLGEPRTDTRCCDQLVTGLAEPLCR